MGSGVTLVATKLYILDVGHGNCAVVVSESREAVVVDVGLGSTLLEFLQQHEIGKIRTVYLSHADEDHVGGLVGLLASGGVVVERVVANSDASKNTKTWDDLAYELDRAHGAGSLVFEPGLVTGEREVLDDVEVRVLGPRRYLVTKGVGGTDASGRKITSNSISACIAISHFGRCVAILPGDIDQVGVDDLLGRGVDLRAAILVYPHHGGRPGSAAVRPFAERLLAAVTPAIVIFSIGRGRHSTPAPETVSVLREVMPGARIICTQLSEHCAAAAPGKALRHLSDAVASGRERGFCCGGTVAVPLDDVAKLEPELTEHVDFIRANAETPLCSPGAGSETGDTIASE